MADASIHSTAMQLHAKTTHIGTYHLSEVLAVFLEVLQEAHTIVNMGAREEERGESNPRQTHLN